MGTRAKKSNIFKKIILPVLEIVIIFAIVSFAISYFSIDRFVRSNAKEKIEEAYNLLKEKKMISHSSGMQVLIYDKNFDKVFLIDNTAYVDNDMLDFIGGLISNYELDEDVLTTINRNGKEYLSKMYVSSTEDRGKGKYYVIIQELTNRIDLIKENFANVFILQLVVLFAVGLIVYKIQSTNEAEVKKQKTIYENEAHDLRTPLVSILGYADGLKSGIIKDKDKACDVILKTGNQLKEMIENILVLSRFDNESYKAVNEEINILDLINEQVEMIKVIDDSKKIDVLDTLSEDLALNTDRKLLVRIIQNLLSNAMKYAKENIVITISNYEGNKGIKHSKNIMISVSDDGEGIDLEKINKVFERYYKGVDGHFGIGLAVVKNSVEFLNGKVDVENCKPHGTRFIIYF